MKIFLKSLILITVLILPVFFVSAISNHKPTVHLNGDQYEILIVGGTWTDSGAIANDVEDGDLTGSIVVSGSANTAIPSIYQIKYSVTDSGLETGEKIRYVAVVEASKKGNPACSDGLDNDFDGLIDEDDVGCYFGDTQKTVIDPAKYNPNKQSENATMDIILVGDEKMDLIKGTPYTEPGYSSFDQEDGDITSTVKVSGTVDHNVLGVYKIFYQNTDSYALEVRMNYLGKEIIGVSSQTWRQVLRHVTVKDPATPPPPPVPPVPGPGGNTDTVLKIYDEKVHKISPNSVWVSWKTNIPADSNVGFGTTTVEVGNTDKSQKYGYGLLAENKSQPSVRDHFVVLTGIKPTTKYYLRAGSEANKLKDVSSELLVISTIESPISTPTISNVCVKYLNSYIKLGGVNDSSEVRKLQTFLNEYEGENLKITGVYDEPTAEAVNRFQLKYRVDILDPWGSEVPTRFVYYTTQKKINEIVCERVFPLNEAQKDEIDLFRQFIEEGTLSPEGTIGFNSNQNIPSGNNFSLLSLNKNTNNQNNENNATGSEQIAGVAGSNSSWQKFKDTIGGILKKVFGVGGEKEKKEKEELEISF